jgi:hypothetical protein
LDGGDEAEAEAEAVAAISSTHLLACHTVAGECAL